MTRVIGFAGWSGAGKTTLLTRLIPELKARGLSVSTLKHAHHAFDIDTPGKDSHQHREAGATEVLVGSARRWALMHELRDEPEPQLADLLVRMSPVDLILVEGFKHDAHVKIEVYRHDNGKPWLFERDPHIAAVASDVVPDTTLPCVSLDDIGGVAHLVQQLAQPLEKVLKQLSSS
jgi:molybdopterin-guanine dinucleotide biosynthesis protein B